MSPPLALVSEPLEAVCYFHNVGRGPVPPGGLFRALLSWMTKKSIHTSRGYTLTCGLFAFSVALFNIHLASGAVNPESRYVEDVRAAEIRQLLRACDAAADRGLVPLVIGDLNAGAEPLSIPLVAPRAATGPDTSDPAPSC